jgi:amino acid transporter
VGSLLFCAGLLFRKVDDIGRITFVLWCITVLAIIYTLAAGFTDWSASRLKWERDAFSSGARVMSAAAAATRFGVYDMTGYYDVCFMGGEVRNPRRTIPISCIATCIIVGFVYILVYLAVLGHLPWQSFVDMYDDDYDGNPPGIMSLFTESRIGKGVAYVVTLVVAITIFGSTYSMLCGFGYLPYAAAKDGTFFSFFAHESKKHPGLADRSLLVVVLFTIPWCFFSLDVVIDAMTTCLVLVQFIGQAVGLLYYRWRTPKSEQPPGWHMPFFPLPCILQIVIFSFIWLSSDSYLLWGSEQPILELSVAFLLMGPVFFLLRSYWRKEWPFVEAEIKDSPVPKDGEGVVSDQAPCDDEITNTVVQEAAREASEGGDEKAMPTKAKPTDDTCRGQGTPRSGMSTDITV